MSIKRYQFTDVRHIQEAADGNLVAYDDHAAEVERLEAHAEDLALGLASVEAEVERLQARVRELEAALREIRDQEWTENVLDPQWAARIATAALAAVSAETEDDDE